MYNQNAGILNRAYTAVEHTALLLSSLSLPLGRARWEVGSKIYWNEVAWTPASSKPTVSEKLT